MEIDTGYDGTRGFSTSATGTCIALMQLGMAFELETPKFIVRQIFMKM